MSIMDFFRGAPVVTPAAAVPTSVAVTANTTIPGPNTPVPDGSNPSIPKVEAGEKSPFDNFKDLWKTPEPGKAGGIPSAVPSFTLDPAKLREVASSIDYSANFPAEKLKAAFGGDETSMREMMNHLGTEAFVHNFSAGAKTMQSAMEKSTSMLTEGTIPELLRRNQVNQLTKSASELFSNPATAPFMQNLTTQMANQFPAASPEGIKDMAVEYFNKMMEVQVGQTGKMIVDKPTDKASKQSTDWDSWLTSGNA